MKKQIILFLAFLIFALTIHAQVAIIPKPNELKLNAGNCSLKKGVNFKVIRGDEPTKMLQKQVNEYLAFRNIPNSTSISTVLSINLLQNKPGDSVVTDAYTLSITPNNIAIVSRTNSGLFYGLQSLYQLINSDTFNVVPCLEIKDQPAFAYRGFQLDVCQHFFGIEVIKKYLDAISKLKINHFIWKLADEQHFRIEIKSNPKLTETETETDDENEKQFYTQEEIKQVVQYARERFINVIPEINFARITSADDTTFLYKKNTMDEIFALFPSKYFNISNPIFISDEIEDYIRASGRKIISIDDEFTKDNIVLSYKNTGIGVNASKKGNEVIMAPRNLCALDNYQDWDDSKLSKTMLYLPLDKIYKFNATDKAKQKVLGSQAHVDTKFMDNENKLTHQVYPRIFALAECFWTQKNKRKSFKDFTVRLEKIGYPGQITEKINLVKFK